MAAPSSSESRGACLETLPVELFIEILKAVPDLHHLQSLRCASPVAAAILRSDRFAAEIIESILGRYLCTTRYIIRVISLVLWGPGPGNLDFGSYNSLRTVLQAVPRQHKILSHLDEAATPIEILHLPAEPLMRMLALAQPVRRLGHSCFHELLSRITAAPRRRPVDREFSYSSWSQQVRHTDRSEPKPPVPTPPTELVEDHPDASAPPFWIEEQRTLVSAWSFALYAVLRGEDVNFGKWGWSENDRNRLHSQPYQSFRDFTAWCMGDRHPDVLELALKSLRRASLSASGNPGLRAYPWNCCAAAIPHRDLTVGAATDRLSQRGAWPLSRLRYDNTWCMDYMYPQSLSPLYRANLEWWRSYGLRFWHVDRLRGLGFLLHVDPDFPAIYDRAMSKLVDQAELGSLDELLLLAYTPEELHRDRCLREASICVWRSLLSEQQRVAVDSW